jgi:hypothetical protein
MEHRKKNHIYKLPKKSLCNITKKLEGKERKKIGKMFRVVNNVDVSIAGIVSLGN